MQAPLPRESILRIPTLDNQFLGRLEADLLERSGGAVPAGNKNYNMAELSWPLQPTHTQGIGARGTWPEINAFMRSRSFPMFFAIPGGRADRSHTCATRRTKGKGS